MGRGLFGLKRNTTPFFVGSNGSELVRGVYAFALDFDNGEIIKKKYYNTNGGPANFYQNERFIYVCYTNHSGRATDGGIKQYATMDTQFGLTADVSNQGKTYVSTFVNENRDHAYACDYYNGQVITVPIVKHKIVTVAQEIQHTGSGPVPRKQASAHPVYCVGTPDQKHLIVLDFGTDEVVVYDFDDKQWLVRNDELTFKCKPGSGPSKMVFSPDGRYAYLTNGLSNLIDVFEYENGHFNLVETYESYPLDDYEDESQISDILYDKAHKLLFVTNKGHDSISVFRIDEETGKLKFVEFVDIDANPISIVQLKTEWLVVACQKGGTLESFHIEAERKRKGVLYETGYSYAVGEPTCMIQARDITHPDADYE